MLFSILPAALLALAAAAAPPAVPRDPNDGMLELKQVVTPQLYRDAALTTRGREASPKG